MSVVGEVGPAFPMYGPEQTQEGASVQVVDSQGRVTTITFGPLVLPDDPCPSI